VWVCCPSLYMQIPWIFKEFSEIVNQPAVMIKQRSSGSHDTFIQVATSERHINSWDHPIWTTRVAPGQRPAFLQRSVFLQRWGRRSLNKSWAARPNSIIGRCRVWVIQYLETVMVAARMDQDRLFWEFGNCYFSTQSHLSGNYHCLSARIMPHSHLSCHPPRYWNRAALGDTLLSIADLGHQDLFRAKQVADTDCLENMIVIKEEIKSDGEKKRNSPKYKEEYVQVPQRVMWAQSRQQNDKHKVQVCMIEKSQTVRQRTRAKDPAKKFTISIVYTLFSIYIYNIYHLVI